MKTSNLKLVKKVILILILDILILGLLVYSMKPEPSSSIVIVLYLPFLFCLNLVIGLFLLYKKKAQSKVFFTNSIIAPAVFYFMFSFALDKYHSQNYKVYTFKMGEKNYELTLDLINGDLIKNGTFFISERENSGSSSGVFNGNYKTYKDTIYLISDNKTLKIVNLKLINFSNNKDLIKLNPRV